MWVPKQPQRRHGYRRPVLRRAIATNAIAALPSGLSTELYETYRVVAMVNEYFKVLENVRVGNMDYGPHRQQQNKLRMSLRDQLFPSAIAGPQRALGKEQ